MSLQLDIETLIKDMLSVPNLDPAGRDAAIDRYAAALAVAIDEYIQRCIGNSGAPIITPGPTTPPTPGP